MTNYVQSGRMELITPCCQDAGRVRVGQQPMREADWLACHALRASVGKNRRA